MVIQYFTSNYMTLMILLSLASLMFVNRNIKIPASKFFMADIFIMLLITITITLNVVLENSVLKNPSMNTADIARLITMHTWSCTLCYMMRPCIIMLQIIIILQDKKYRLLCTIPSILNAILYATALFGSKIAFFINENNHWFGGPLYTAVYFTQLFYLFLLLCISIHTFRHRNISKSIVLITIFIQAVLAAVLEYGNVTPSYTEAITAFCILEYYIYLSMIYRQELHDQLIQRELEAAKNELFILRNQIQPHFVYNTLNIIRSLARTNNQKTVDAINSFSKYLRTHINAIQSEDMIPFEEEIKNVQIYVNLAQTDYPGKIEIVYDFLETDFDIPPLSLEPIVENAIQHGISRKGGKITITTRSENDAVVICVADNGTAKKQLTDRTIERLGIGLENARKRLDIQCNGSLTSDFTTEGCKVTITIPKFRRTHNENTYS